MNNSRAHSEKIKITIVIIRITMQIYLHIDHVIPNSYKSSPFKTEQPFPDLSTEITFQYLLLFIEKKNDHISCRIIYQKTET